MRKMPLAAAVAAAITISGCGRMTSLADERSFDGDVRFLRQHTDVVLLSDGGGAAVVVAPRWQGRVMTSTVDQRHGTGYGWINDDLIRGGKTGPHINVWGGEDRFWMGPEGGQYAIFFGKGTKFTLQDWQTPACIDTEAYRVVASNDRGVSLRHAATVSNYSGATFDVDIERTVRLLTREEAASALGAAAPESVRMVGYQSENAISNAGTRPWTRDTGLLSIWILGMFKPSPEATVIVPFVEGPESRLGAIVNDAYFGKVPADRLRIEKGVMYFKGDGQMRSKIGVGPRRCKDVIGSYEPRANVLTIVQYTLPAGAGEYVNSMWEMQSAPYAGDVVNSYNDGPSAPGQKPLGPFYELETSSPAAALKPGERLTHVHRTFHFTGPKEQLRIMAKRLLGTDQI